jgi:uncharacterized membrane protein YeaQ/YmgE (transglycosylase-associated protein family)
MLLFILILALTGLIIGGLARLAVPGPDPMSIWLTLGIGLIGSLGGGLISRIFFGGYFSFLLSLVVAVLLVIAHRRSQGRAVWGPGARRRPGAR